MKNLIKKLTILLIAFMLTFSGAIAKEKIKFIALIDQDFSTTYMTEDVQIKTIRKLTLADGLIIPQRSAITAETIQSQRERRWHKSGYILCKLKNYQIETEETPIDISDKNIYMVIRKYEPVNKKEAAILGTEILLTQAASFFAPGVDILYFFTKGAILREKDSHWFKAGVSNAYENSICWFWLKGKPIDIDKGQLISMKDIKEEKVYKLKEQIEKRRAKQTIKDEKRAIKKEIKMLKAEQKEAIKAYKKRTSGKYLYTELIPEINIQTTPQEFLPKEWDIEYMEQSEDENEELNVEDAETEVNNEESDIENSKPEIKNEETSNGKSETPKENEEQEL